MSSSVLTAHERRGAYTDKNADHNCTPCLLVLYYLVITVSPLQI